jgi:hypothetical protein
MSAPSTEIPGRWRARLQASVPLLVTVVIHGVLVALAGYFFVSSQVGDKKKVFEARNATPPTVDKAIEHRIQVARSSGGSSRPNPMEPSARVYKAAAHALPLPDMPALQLPGMPDLRAVAASAFAGQGQGSGTGMGIGAGKDSGAGNGMDSGTGESRVALIVFGPVQNPIHEPPGTIGWYFETKRPITVTHLGFFDENNDGLADAVKVEIHSSISGGRWICEGRIPAGTGGILVNGFRNVSITPVILPPGKYMMWASSAAAQQHEGWHDRVLFTHRNKTQFGPGLDFVDPKRSTQVHSCPHSDVAEAMYIKLGPNFLYHENAR